MAIGHDDPIVAEMLARLTVLEKQMRTHLERHEYEDELRRNAFRIDLTDTFLRKKPVPHSGDGDGQHVGPSRD